MENSLVITSKKCAVPDMDDACSTIKVDLSIVDSDENYGLMYSYSENLDDESLILPCQYENLYFIEADEITFLGFTIDGKHGLFKIEAHDNHFGKGVVISRLLRCIYDRIEACKTSSCFLLYRKNEVVCYDAIAEKIITSGHHCEELNSQHLLCQTSAGSELWDLANHQLVSILPANVHCQYIGIYEQGDVFLVNHGQKENKPILQQLMFCECFGGAVRLSPKNSQLVIHTRMASNICHVVGVEMSWGNKTHALSTEAISAFTTVWENHAEDP